MIAPKGMTVSVLQAHQRANSTAVAILYGAVGSPGFKELHDTLMQSVERGEKSPAFSASLSVPCHFDDSLIRRHSLSADLWLLM